MSNMAEKRPHETKSEPETENESELEVVTEICCSMVQSPKFFLAEV